MFEMYEDVIRDICYRQVSGLDHEQQQLLWLWTEGYADSWVEKDEVSIDDFEDEPAAKELYDRVFSVAASEVFFQVTSDLLLRRPQAEGDPRAGAVVGSEDVAIAVGEVRQA